MPLLASRLVVGRTSLMVVVRSNLRFLSPLAARLSLPLLLRVGFVLVSVPKEKRLVRESAFSVLHQGDVDDNGALVMLFNRNNSTSETSP